VFPDEAYPDQAIPEQAYPDQNLRLTPDAPAPAQPTRTMAEPRKRARRRRGFVDRAGSAVPEQQVGVLARLAGYVPPGENELAVRRWYTTIGVSLLATTALAFVSGTLFGVISFRLSWPQALPIGVFWALLVLAVDVLIIRQPRYPAKGGALSRLGARVATLVTFGLRLALAVGVAILVAEPVVVFMFADRIDRQLPIDQQRQVDAFAIDRYVVASGQAEGTVQAAVALQEELWSWESRRSAQEDVVRVERDGGSVITQQRGCGTQCAREIAKLETIIVARDAAAAKCLVNLPVAQQQIAGYLAGADTAVADREERLTDPESVGYLDRRIALHNLEAPALGRQDGMGATTEELRAQRDATRAAVADKQSALPACTLAAPSGAASSSGSTGTSAAPTAPTDTESGGNAASELASAQSLEESRTILLQHVVIGLVLFIIDLLPLSIKALGGTNPVHSRVIAAGAKDIYADERTKSQALEHTRSDREAAELARKRRTGQAKNAYLAERHYRHLMAARRFRTLLAASFGRAKDWTTTGQALDRHGRAKALPENVVQAGTSEGFAVGHVLDGRWEILASLSDAAQSGYARLWRVRDRSDGDDVDGNWVLKEFQEGDATRDEIQMVHDLRNTKPRPGRPSFLAPVEAAGLVARPDQAPRAYFVTPYYPLGTLWTYLPRTFGSRVPLYVCVAAAFQITAGLYEAQSRFKRDHNDTKPTNVAVAADGEDFRIALFDWGLGRSAVGPDAARGGTPFYAAPEQWLGTAASTGASLANVYSVAATLYWMICGHPPLVDVALTQGVDVTDQYACDAFFRSGPHPATPIQERMGAEIPPLVAELVDRWLSPNPLERVHHLDGGAVDPTEELPMYWALREIEELERACRAGRIPNALVGSAMCIDVYRQPGGPGAAPEVL
jgi:hypothetical protein